MPYYFCNKRLNLAYLRIPKCACTTIEIWMAQNHGNYDPRNPFPAHSKEANRTYFDEIASAKKGVPGYFRFSFVRHPVSRFISFYNDKIGGANKERALLDELDQYGLKHGMAIEQCLERILRYPNQDCLNPHFAPQHQFILHEDKLCVDFIGRLETFDSDIKILARGVNVAIPSLKANVGRKPKDHLSPEALEMIARIYQQDFALFGYDLTQKNPL